MTAHALYVTDPACPWSWGLEPGFRRLEREFGDQVEIRVVMGGLAREIAPASAAEARAREWLSAADRTGMPVDARAWWEDPIASSYPACLAVVAAREQGLERPYLRRLRTGLLARRRKLDATEALVEEARAVPGLDVARFRVDLESSAILEAFGADLELAGERRARQPVLAFTGGAELGAGATPDDLADAARAAGAEPTGAAPLGVEAALRAAGPLGAAEVAAVCDLPGPRAEAELWALAVDWRVRAERSGTGVLWSAA